MTAADNKRNYNNDGATGGNSLAAGVGTQASGISPARQLAIMPMPRIALPMLQPWAQALRLLIVANSVALGSNSVVILGIMVLAFVSMLLAVLQPIQKIYSIQLLQKLKAGEIKSVEIDKDNTSLIAQPKAQIKLENLRIAKLSAYCMVMRLLQI